MGEEDGEGMRVHEHRTRVGTRCPPQASRGGRRWRTDFGGKRRGARPPYAEGHRARAGTYAHGMRMYAWLACGVHVVVRMACM